MSDQLFDCPHRCPKCQDGWVHRVPLVNDALSCKLKIRASCTPCLREMSNGIFYMGGLKVGSLEDVL